MSRHEGVSCDSCMKSNFGGRRYKCLICYDYDLCATCYDENAVTTRHLVTHPMQCILTRADYELYYGGEAVSCEQPQSLTCPYCCQMGFTEVSLQDHLATEHVETPTMEVVCPICASLPGGEPNHLTDDLSAHLALEHRASRESEEPAMINPRQLRRLAPSSNRGRPRRNMQFESRGGAGGLFGAASSTSRETIDPIAELLSQLTNVRNRAVAAQSVSSQLQQLELQLQSTRQQLERLPRRTAEAKAASQAPQLPVMDFSSALASHAKDTVTDSKQFLIPRCHVREDNGDVDETLGADQQLFVQELLLSSLTRGFGSDERNSADIAPSFASDLQLILNGDCHDFFEYPQQGSAENFPVAKESNDVE